MLKLLIDAPNAHHQTYQWLLQHFEIWVNGKPVDPQNYLAL